MAAIHFALASIQPSPCSLKFYPSNACTFCLPFPGSHNYTLWENQINNPIVLLHGFGDFPGWTRTWRSFKIVLRETGVPLSNILILHVPRLDSIAKRVDNSIGKINLKFPGEMVHIIVHSMVLSLLFPVVSIMNDAFLGGSRCQGDRIKSVYWKFSVYDHNCHNDSEVYSTPH